jgi:hypothetical protein
MTYFKYWDLKDMNMVENRKNYITSIYFLPLASLNNNYTKNYTCNLEVKGKVVPVLNKS